jgi:hypothetical protein
MGMVVMSSQEMSRFGDHAGRAVAQTQQIEATAYYRLVMVAMLPALAILLAASAMMTKLLMV